MTIADPKTVPQWITVLSGWAAFAVGIPTVIILAGQLSEQRRATRFSIGDIAPDFFQSGNEMDRITLFSFVNNNRREVIILGLAATLPENVSAVAYEPPGHDYANGRWIPEVSVPGWTDRAKAPNRETIVASFFDNNGDGEEYLGEVTVEVRFRYRDSPDEHTLTTSGNIEHWTQRRHFPGLD